MQIHILLATFLCTINLLSNASAGVKIIVYDINGKDIFPDAIVSITIMGNYCSPPVFEDKTGPNGELDVEKTESLYKRCKRIAQQERWCTNCEQLNVTVRTTDTQKQNHGTLNLVNGQWQPEVLTITLRNSEMACLNPFDPCINPCYPCFNLCDPCSHDIILNCRSGNAILAIQQVAKQSTTTRMIDRSYGRSAIGITSATVVSVGEAKIKISVPQDAVVLINGKSTTKTGTNREYYSTGLKYGRTYKYVVRAQVVRDGKIIEDAREILLQANDNKSLAFNFPSADDAQLTAAR